jgi:ankyrin repeat protein
VNLHELLDFGYGENGDEELRRRLAAGAPIEDPAGAGAETPLHVAVRRRRLSAVEILLDHGAAIDARTRGGKTAYAHAIRRGFAGIVELLVERGADRGLAPADELATAVCSGDLEAAAGILSAHPGAARTGNPEEDRLLADMAGRVETGAVEFLIAAGADLAAPGLDDGTPLHQAAWFGQPANAKLLIEAGAPVDTFDSVHNGSPISWATHGSRYSGEAAGRQDTYRDVVALLLAAGCSLRYPDERGDDRYLMRLRREASEAVRELLPSPSPPAG